MPFEARVPEGRHHVGEGEAPQIDVLKSNTALKQIEQKLRDEEEKRRRAMDLKRLNKMKQKNLPKAIAEVNKANNVQLLQFNTKINLPHPVIPETELQSISRYANGGGNSAFAMPKSKLKNTMSATSMLMGEYS